MLCASLFSVACTPVTYLVKARLFPPPVVNVGDSLVDGNLVDVSGGKKQLSDYTGGKYSLLCFCSSGCGYCIACLPEMKEVSETYPENLTIISISIDTNKEWKKGLAEHHTPWVNLRDPKSWAGLAPRYGADGGTPYYVIISPEGKVVDRWFGFREGWIKKKMSKNVKKI